VRSARGGKTGLGTLPVSGDFSAGVRIHDKREISGTRIINPEENEAKRKTLLVEKEDTSSVVCRLVALVLVPGQQEVIGYTISTQSQTGTKHVF
jgi:hypothetical protein